MALEGAGGEPAMSATSAPERVLTIGLLWHSPNSGNLGVGALTFGNIALAREAAASAGVVPRFHVIGFAEPGLPNYLAGDDIAVTFIDGRAMLPGGALWRALGACDVVLDIGGGDSFTDIYGTHRFAYMWASKLAARILGKPLILSPQTIGPFEKAWTRLLAGYISERAHSVFARDPKSYTALEAIAPDAKAHLAADVAFAMPFDRVDHGEGTHVGINVSGLLFNGGYSGANEFGMEIDYPAFTRKLIAALLQRGDVTVHLVPHVLSDALPQDDDRAAVATLAGEFPRARPAPAFAGPVEAKSYIAGLDMLVGGRMHACIAAHSSGVPVIPVAYSRKFAGLFEGVLDYPHLIPVTGMGTDDAVAFVLDRFGRRGELAKACEASRPRVTELLGGYTSALREVFADHPRT